MPRLIPIDDAPQRRLVPIEEPQSGSILPISSTPDGSWQFDSDAGLLGVAKRAFKLPGEVASGQLQRTVPMFPDEQGQSELGAIQTRNPEYYDRAAEAAPFMSPITPSMNMGKGVSVTRGRVRDVPEPPSTKQLFETGSRQFDAGRKLDVRFEPAYVNRLGKTAEAQLRQEGFDPTNAPKTFAALKDMQGKAQDPNAFAAYDDILKIRNRLKKARMDFNNPADKQAAERVIKSVEEFVQQAPGTSAVRSGPAADLLSTHRQALGNYAAAKRSQDIGDTSRSAVRRAKASNSGQNIGNTLRQRAASILDSPKKSKGFSKEELAALEKVAEGTASQNVLRYVGNFLGGGGGLGGVVPAGLAGTAGAMAGGPIGGVAATAGVLGLGFGSKMASNNLTKRAVSDIGKMTRARSPLYEQMIKSAEWKSASPAKRKAMFNAFIAMQQAEKQ